MTIKLSLEVLPDLLAITRLKPTDSIPEWAQRSSFFSITKTSDELSIVCRQAEVHGKMKSERNWRAIKVNGPLDFGLTGILVSLAHPLAASGVSIFAISTFDTDYVLVKQENLERAMAALESAGHIFPGPFAKSDFVQAELYSPRLLLEPIVENHAAELWELFSDDNLHTFTPYIQLTMEEQRKTCSRWATRRSPDGKELWLNWLARDISTRLSVGHFQAGLTEDGAGSIGYVVARNFQDKGYATEALKTIFEYLQNSLMAKEVKAWSDTRNLASHRVANKLGMVQTELIKNADFFRGSSSDEFVFSKGFRK